MSIFAPDLLAGRTALITGGATGLGFAIACEFSRLGARTVLAGRKQENLDKAVQEIVAMGGQAMGVQTDVRNYEQVEKAVAAAVERFGGLDILVNSAAGNFFCPTEQLSPNGWRTVVDIDLNGTFHCCKAAFEPLKQSRFEGRIISLVTTLASSGWPGQAHAGAAKAGIISLSRALAVEWAAHKIHVNTISPGPIGGTEGVKKLYEDRGALDLQLKRVALGRLGDPMDIANAAVYLASPAGDYVTGADLVVDGGRWLNYVAHTAAA
jgi:NAD(P)-dependent dehydrogenase (short-subunit alcohol dehydrogenase family)